MIEITKLMFDLCYYYSLSGYFIYIVTGVDSFGWGIPALLLTAGIYIYLSRLLPGLNNKQNQTKLIKIILCAAPISLVFTNMETSQIVQYIPAWAYTTFTIWTNRFQFEREDFGKSFSLKNRTYLFGLLGIVIPTQVPMKPAQFGGLPPVVGFAAIPLAVTSVIPYLIIYLLSGICMLRIFRKDSKYQSRLNYGVLLLLLAGSIVLCLIVYGYIAGIDVFEQPILAVITVVISLLLIIISIFDIDKHRDALAYKNEYEIAQSRLEAQIEHYQKLYQAQHEVRQIRHEMYNHLTAISGEIKNGLIEEAISRINNLHGSVLKTDEVVNTGYPPIDAVLSSKIDRAKESSIRITYNILIDTDLKIDQFDMAVVVASALDNAIEGVERSGSEYILKNILLNIGNSSDYIVILVENYSSKKLTMNLRTSKLDKTNHGFGIAHMRSVARKYDGEIHPHYDPIRGKFSLRVLMRNRKK